MSDQELKLTIRGDSRALVAEIQKAVQSVVGFTSATEKASAIASANSSRVEKAFKLMAEQSRASTAALQETTAALQKLAGASEKTGDDVTKAAAKQNNALRDLARRNAELESSARQLALGLATLIAPMGLATKAAIDYDQALRNVDSIAQLSAPAFRELHKSVLELSSDPNIVKGPADLAKGLYDIYSVGFQGKEALDILRQSAIGATAGMTTTKTAANILTSTLTSQIGGVHNAKEAMDALFQIVNKGKADFPELAAQIGTVFPLARQAGVTLQEVGAAFIVMNKHGFSAAEATTAITNLLREIVQPSDRAKKALGEHANILSITNLRSVGLLGVMQQLNQVFGGNTDKLLEIIPEHRAMNAALELGAKNSGDFAQALEDMRHAGDNAGQTLSANEHAIAGTASKLEKFRSEMEKLGINLGDRVLPALNRFVDFLNKHPDAAAMGIAVGTIAVSVNQLAQAFRTLGGLKAFEWLMAAKGGEGVGAAVIPRLGVFGLGVGVGSAVTGQNINAPDPLAGMRENGSIQQLLPPELRAGNAEERKKLLERFAAKHADADVDEAATILGLQNEVGKRLGLGRGAMPPALPFIPPKNAAGKPVALPPPVETEAMKKARAELAEQIRAARAQAMPEDTALEKLNKRTAEADVEAEKEKQRVLKELREGGLKDEQLQAQALKAIDDKRLQARRKATEEYQRDVEQERKLSIQAMPDSDVEERRRKRVAEENDRYAGALRMLEKARAGNQAIQNEQRQHNDRLYQIDQQAFQEQEQRQAERLRGFEEALGKVRFQAQEDARKAGGSDERIERIGNLKELEALKSILPNLNADAVGADGARRLREREVTLRQALKRDAQEQLRRQMEDLQGRNTAGGVFTELRNMPQMRELLQMTEALETSDEGRAKIKRELTALDLRQLQIEAEIAGQGQASREQEEKRLAAALQANRELADQERRIQDMAAEAQGPAAFRANREQRLGEVRARMALFSTGSGDTERPETADEAVERQTKVAKLRIEEARIALQIQQIDKSRAVAAQELERAQYDLARSLAATDAERLTVDEEHLSNIRKQIADTESGDLKAEDRQKELNALKREEAEVQRRIEEIRRRPERAREQVNEQLQLMRLSPEQRRVREEMDKVAGEFGFKSIVEAEKEATPEILAEIRRLAGELDKAYREMHDRWRMFWSGLAEDVKRSLKDIGTNALEGLFDGLLGGKGHKDLGKQLLEQLRGLFSHSLAQIAMQGIQGGIGSLGGLLGGLFGGRGAVVPQPGSPNFVGPMPQGIAPGEKGGVPQILQQVPQLSSALGGIIDVFSQGKGDLGSVLGSLIQMLGSFGGMGGGMFGGILSAVTSLFSFDDPINDSKARRWGFDFGTMFGQGVGDAKLSPAGGAGGSGLTVHIHQHNHGVAAQVDMNRANRDLTDNLWRTLRTKG